MLFYAGIRSNIEACLLLFATQDVARDLWQNKRRLCRNILQKLRCHGSDGTLQDVAMLRCEIRKSNFHVECSNQYVYLKFNVSSYLTYHKNIALMILLKYVYNNEV